MRGEHDRDLDPCAASLAFATNIPPRCVFERQDAATGTIVAPSTCGHTANGFPVMFAIFRPTNVPMSLVIAIAALFAAATSALIAFAPAEMRSEFAQSPAPSALSF